MPEPITPFDPDIRFLQRKLADALHVNPDEHRANELRWQLQLVNAHRRKWLNAKIERCEA